MFHVSSVHLFLSSLLLTSGCATVVNGTHQEIGVSSNPSGASVMVDNQKNFITLASVDLKRNQSHTFVFHKDGYKDDSFVITSGTSGWVWGNILIGGLIGTAVDFASGGARKLSQESVHVSLVPLAANDIPTAAVLPAAVVPAVLPVAEPIIPAVLKQANEPAMYNAAPTADTQLRNLDREFRAGRIGIDEYRQMKKVLTGE